MDFIVKTAFAHDTGIVHKEVPASVDPMLALGIVVIVAIGGIIIWKVMFSKKQATPTQTSQSQTEVSKTTLQSTQPEKLEAEK